MNVQDGGQGANDIFMSIYVPICYVYYSIYVYYSLPPYSVGHTHNQILRFSLSATGIHKIFEIIVSHIRSSDKSAKIVFSNCCNLYVGINKDSLCLLQIVLPYFDP